MNFLGVVIGILVALGLGGLGSWYYFIKIRKPKREQGAKDAVDDSEKNDPNREEIKNEIEERIKKNEEIRNKLKEKLKNLQKGK
jgi:hypothetical protein